MMNTRYVYPFLLLAVLLGAIASCGNGSREDQIEDLMDRADESFVLEGYSRLLEIQNNIDEEEMELSNAMLSSQEEFATNNNFELIDNPLDEEINAINEGL